MPSTGDFDQALSAIVSAIAAIYLLRATVGGLLCAAGSIPGRLGRVCAAAGAVVTPRLVRRVVGGLMGAAALGGLVGVGTGNAVPLDRGTVAAPSASTGAGSVESEDARRAVDAGVIPTIDRGVVGERFAGSRRSPRAPSPGANRPQARQGVVVTVKPGDCLWTIAAAHLPRNATASQIDREWRRWYAANRHKIGPNPDLLAVGLRLGAPA